MTFSVSAQGPLVRYAWKKGSTFLQDGGGISGATTTNLTLTAVDASAEGNYFCQATADGCSTPKPQKTSQSVHLTVFASSPLINTNPQDVFLCSTSGAPATFTIEADDALTYQWRKDSAPIDGATNTSFTIASPAPDDAASYDCVLGNPCFSTR